MTQNCRFRVSLSTFFVFVTLTVLSAEWIRRSILHRQLNSISLGVDYIPSIEHSWAQFFLAKVVPGNRFLPVYGIWLKPKREIHEIKTFAYRMHRLRRIRINSCNTSAKEIKWLVDFCPDLTEIEFDSCEIDLEQLVPLARAKRLSSLRFNNCSFKDSGFRSYQIAYTQRAIDGLSFVSCENVDLRFFSHFFSTKKLELTNYSKIIGDDLFVAFERIGPLEELALSDSQALRFVPTTQDLKRLRISRLSYDVGLDFLSKFPSLEELELSSSVKCDLTQSPQLPRLKLLRLIDIDYGITRDCICSLEKFPNIEQIDFSFSRFTSTAFQDFPRLEFLRSIIFLATNVNVEHVSSLNILDSLERQDLSFCSNISDDGLKKLLIPPKLNWIEVSGIGITEDTVRSFKGRYPQITLSFLRKHAPVGQ